MDDWIKTTSNPEHPINHQHRDNWELENLQLVMFGVVPMALYEWIHPLHPSHDHKWKGEISRAIADAAVKTRKKLWLPRCADIIEWEKENNISQQQKRPEEPNKTQAKSKTSRKARSGTRSKKNDKKTAGREDVMKARELVPQHHQEIPTILNSKKKTSDDKILRGIIVGKDDRKTSKREQEQIKVLRQQIRERRHILSEEHEDLKDLPPLFYGEAIEYTDPLLKLLDEYLESCALAESEIEANQRQQPSPNTPHQQIKRRIEGARCDVNTMDRSGIG